MYINYSSSETYAPHTAISILSLLENNKDVDYIKIFLIDMGISDASKAKIQEIVYRYNRDIEFVHIEDHLILDYLGETIPSHYGSYATYARLCAPILYPKEVHKIIFVDSDMIIKGSLSEVYDADMGDCAVAAVPARFNIHKDGMGNAEEMAIAQSHKYYFNCGFLVVDIDNWIKHGITEKVKDATKKLTLLTYKDQTILNCVLDDRYYYKLPCKYNYPMHMLPQYLKKYWSGNYEQLNRNEILEAADVPIVIHYVGESCRPWYKENTSCLAGEYYKYKTMSPFKDEPLQSIFDTPKYKKMSSVEKLFLRLMYKTYQIPIGYPLYAVNQWRIKRKLRKVREE